MPEIKEIPGFIWVKTGTKDGSPVVEYLRLSNIDRFENGRIELTKGFCLCVDTADEIAEKIEKAVAESYHEYRQKVAIDA